MIFRPVLRKSYLWISRLAFISRSIKVEVNQFKKLLLGVYDIFTQACLNYLTCILHKFFVMRSQVMVSADFLLAGIASAISGIGS